MNSIQAQRVFMPGSEWLYYKIYSGPNTIEQILCNELNSLIEDLLEQKTIDKFFFLRYTDPDYHLRLRLHIPDITKYNIVIQLFRNILENYISNRLIWKICIDSYTREIERYGGNTIEDVESLFYFNSVATLKIISHTEEEEYSHQRWIWGIRYIDLVLGQFGLDLNDKIALFETLSKGYGIEFNMNKSLKVNLDTKLRYHKSQIEKIFSINEGTQFPLYDALLKTIDISKLPIENILKIKTANKLEIAFESLLVSIIHMHYNRLFRTQQRLYELVIYYSMHKFYKSLAARIINNPSIKILVY